MWLVCLHKATPTHPIWLIKVPPHQLLLCADVLCVNAPLQQRHHVMSCDAPEKAWVRDTYCLDHLHRKRWGGRRKQSRHWKHKAMDKAKAVNEPNELSLCGISKYQEENPLICLLKPYLPTSRSFRGPYLSMTMPMGRVMADSRKEPTVKARFNISSWSLQMGQPFISRYSSESAGCGVDAFERLRLEVFPGWPEKWESGEKEVLNLQLYRLFRMTMTQQCNTRMQRCDNSLQFKKALLAWHFLCIAKAQS